MNQKRSRFWHVTDLLDWTIRDINGHAVGRIADLIIDPTEGRIAYLRIHLHDVGSSIGLRITVPWSAVSRFSRTQRDVRIAVRRDTLVRLGLQNRAH